MMLFSVLEYMYELECEIKSGEKKFRLARLTALQTTHGLWKK